MLAPPKHIAEFRALVDEDNTVNEPPKNTAQSSPILPHGNASVTHPSKSTGESPVDASIDNTQYEYVTPLSSTANKSSSLPDNSRAEKNSLETQRAENLSGLNRKNNLVQSSTPTNEFRKMLTAKGKNVYMSSSHSLAGAKKTPKSKGRKKKTVSSAKRKSSSFKIRISTSKSDKVPEGFCGLLVPRPPMPLGNSYHKKQFIVNEVLCYIQNKMDSEAKEAIVKLASQFFKYEDIITAKKLLYETVPVTGRRLIIHRGDDKARQEVTDIYYHFHAGDLDEVPIFLAMDITMLPVLSGNSNDMTAILRKIEVMQTQISTLMEAQKTTSELISAQVCTEQLPESKTNDKSHEHVDNPKSIVMHGDVNTESSSQETKNDHEQRNTSKEHDTTLYSDDLDSSLSQDSSESSDEEEIKEEPVAVKAHMHQTAKSQKPKANLVQPKIKTRIFNASKKTIQPFTSNNNNQVASQTDCQANLWSNNPVGRARVTQDSTIQGTGTAPGL